MKYFVVRHAQTDANRITRAAFGVEGAPINDTGKEQAKSLKRILLEKGIDPETEPVAVSELLRARQTAEVAGFKRIFINGLLNEVNADNPEKTLDLISQAKVPEMAARAAQALIANPPSEQVWVTHGLLIAALESELGISNMDKFIPDYCEVREIEF